jgi:hypothetical protein
MEDDTADPDIVGEAVTEDGGGTEDEKATE